MILCQVLSMAFLTDALIKKLERELKTQASSQCFSVLAQMYYEKGDYKKAEKLCLEGLKHHPSHLSAFLLLTDIYLFLDKKDQAFEYLNKAKALSPQHPKIYEKLAQLYTKQNKLEESVEAYKTLLVLRPDHLMASDMLSYLEKFISQEEVSVKSEPLKEDQSLSQASEEVSIDIKTEEKEVQLNKLDPIEALESLDDSISREITQKIKSEERLEKKAEDKEKKLTRLHQMLSQVENHIQKVRL